MHPVSGIGWNRKQIVIDDVLGAIINQLQLEINSRRGLLITKHSGLRLCGVIKGEAADLRPQGTKTVLTE